MKYFVVSDIHNHYAELMSALDGAGFDKNNPAHKIILAGDAFDRGDEAVQVFSFLKELIKTGKLIWIAGNHEFFLLKRYEEGSFTRHGDTYNTMYQIAADFSKGTDLSDEEVFTYSKAAGLENLIRNNVQPFYETEHYVFTHGSLPAARGEYNPAWRDVPLKSWCMPAMKNGMKEAMVHGVKVPGKTIVCGHSPAAYGNAREGVGPDQWDNKELDSRQRLRRDLSNIDLYKPFYGDGVIGIDANVYKTGFVNCILIDEDE